MKRFKDVKVFSLIIAVCLIASGLSPVVHAQPKASLSVSYDLFPYENFSDPPTGLENSDILSNVPILQGGFCVWRLIRNLK